MDITVYLPDEIGSWAKENDVNLSRLLREAVERKRKTAEWLRDSEAHELGVEGEHGGYTVRLYGRCLAAEFGFRNRYSAYATEDGRLFVHDQDDLSLEQVSHPDAIEGWRDSDPDVYVEAMRVLGEEPVIEIGRAS